MKKIGFVTPWFGEYIPGGAEMELRGITQHLSQSGLKIEILTTCVQQFSSDWNKNHHKEGVQQWQGIPIRRFRVRQRNTGLFDKVNAKLMCQLPVSQEEENTYFREMINSPRMYDYMRTHEKEYELFVFIPYMFGTTYMGCLTCPQKAVIIPCLHDESYAYMQKTKECFENVRGIIFNARPEFELANRIYNLSNINTQVLGIGIDTDIASDCERFRQKHHIDAPFILYAGRKDYGKNVHVLLHYFQHYKKRNLNDLKLVLIGGGEIPIPKDIKNDVFDLGFVSVQDKYDACAAAEFLCQPSAYESFSLVIMESWLCGRPVLVNEKCAVTRHFAGVSNGGLFFDNYLDFEGAVNYITHNPEKAVQMGENGRAFVVDNFSWDVIVQKYTEYFQRVSE